MRVKMLTTQFACPDGITRVTYEAGKEYDITDTNILTAFYQAGAISPVEADKAIHAAPETKPMRGRPRAKI
jgi:hypothetical protein